MPVTNFDSLASKISTLSPVSNCGTILGTEGNLIVVGGLSGFCSVGDSVTLPSESGTQFGEIVSLRAGSILVLPSEGTRGCTLKSTVRRIDASGIAPDVSWLGRVVDPFGQALDNQGIIQGTKRVNIRAAPPPAADRNRLGARLETGMSIFNTFLPLVSGQRLGLFAGSGIGKSTLLADLCRRVDADVIVLALIGERGRELREFTEDVLGPEGLAKTVVVAATSDQSALVRRRAGWASMSVAEYFRDRGARVLYLCDSVTRFADAHREVAISCGEKMASGGYPPSTTQAVTELCERAGPGHRNSGDITALFSVLVAGSNMEEPLADLVRGVLDGHVVMSRKIAERGRFPAIDILRSVSRSLPAAATDAENQILMRARQSMSSYAEVELMLQAGLYETGSNAEFDEAIIHRPKLEAFLAQKDLSVAQCFKRLTEISENTGD